MASSATALLCKPMLENRRLVAIFTIGLCILYVGVRLWRLTDSCLWFDEIFSTHAAEHDWGSLFWFVAQDLIHPPLSYALLKIWITIGGESVFWLRLFSVFFSVAALFPFLHLCRELKLERSTTLIALALVAVNGSLIKYAQEVRMYAPLLCLSLFSLWLFARFYFRGKNIWILTLVNILLIYTHYFGWFVIATQVATIFIFQRVKIRHVLLMFGIAVVAFLPWVIAIAKAAGTGASVTQNIGWMSRPGLRAILDFAFDLVEPFYYQQSSAEPSTLFYVTIPLLALIVIAKVLFLVDWKKRDEKNVVYVLSLFVLVPIVLAFLISWLAPVSIWGSRHLIIVFAPASILVALFVDKIVIRAVRYIALTLIVLLIGTAAVRTIRKDSPEFVWCTWEKLSEQWITAPHLSSRPKKVYAFEDLVAYHLWFGIRELPNYKVGLISGVQGIPNDSAYFVPRGFGEITLHSFEDLNEETFWIAFRKEVPDPGPGISFIGPSIGTPVTEIERKGYEIDDARRIKVGRETCFLIKFRKVPPPP